MEEEAVLGLFPEGNYLSSGKKKNGEQLASVHLFVLSNLALPHSYLPFTLFHRAVNILRHMEDTE